MQTALSMRRKPGVDSFRRKPTSASPSFDVLGFCRPVVGKGLSRARLRRVIERVEGVSCGFVAENGGKRML